MAVHSFIHCRPWLDAPSLYQHPHTLTASPINVETPAPDYFMWLFTELLPLCCSKHNFLFVI